MRKILVATLVLFATFVTTSSAFAQDRFIQDYEREPICSAGPAVMPYEVWYIAIGEDKESGIGSFYSREECELARMNMPYDGRCYSRMFPAPCRERRDYEEYPSGLD